MCSKTIMSFTSTFIAADIFKNYFYMVEFTAVRWSLLARLATVSVLLFSWREISCPSSYYSFERQEYALRFISLLWEKLLLYELLVSVGNL